MRLNELKNCHKILTSNMSALNLKAYLMLQIIVQSLSRVQLFVILWTVVCQASLSFTISQSLFKLMSIESVMPSQPSHPLPPPFPFALYLFQHQVISNELALRIR